MAWQEYRIGDPRLASERCAEPSQETDRMPRGLGLP